MTSTHRQCVSRVELEKAFALREESFMSGPLSLRMLMPKAADELLDEKAFEHEEFMPYWADLWPSARAMAAHLIEAAPPREARIIEIGCGLALPSIVLRKLGHERVTATDWSEDALRFATLNAMENATLLEVLRWSWSDAPIDLPRFDVIIACDVLYEARNVVQVADAAERLAQPGGQLLLADPGRANLPRFISLLKERGWDEEWLRERKTPHPAGGGAVIATISIRSFRRAAT